VFDAGDGHTLRCACSVGVAAYPFSLAHVDALTWEQVAAVADQALYLAKRAGANASISVTATGAVTVEELSRHPGESLSRWIDAGLVTIERSPGAPARV
jgi:GGDEF domain-containing protein